ncbi:MAG: hydroxyacid dehydrogenase [Halobacteriales archaeon]
MPPTILVTLSPELQTDFFTRDLRARLADCGNVSYNTDGAMRQDELAERLPGVDVVVTGWDTPQFDGEVLEAAGDLELLAHTGGSVAGLASGELYDRGVTVCSANRVMARFVAEHVLGSVLAAERSIVDSALSMRAGEYDRDVAGRTLFDADVGFVGLGTVGRHLLALLDPFEVNVSVYDPYVSPAALTEHGFASKATLGAALASDVVSIHAARTPETVGMIGREELAAIPDGALLVNAARAELIEQEPLEAELDSGRIRAALDVFHDEPLAAENPLRDLENVQLTPHTAGGRVRTAFTEAVVGEVERYRDDRALQHEIPREQYERMTR